MAIYGGGVFGERLGCSSHISGSPTLHSQTKQGRWLAVTELRIEKAGYGATSLMGSDDAYLICLDVKRQTTHELWCASRSVCSTGYEAGATYLLDLRMDPIPISAIRCIRCISMCRGVRSATAGATSWFVEHW
jgi:AraC family transcriptional regulator